MLYRYSYRFITSLLLLLTAGSLYSQSSLSSLENKRKQAEKEIAYINTLLTKTGSEKKSTVEQLTLLQRKIDYRKELNRSTLAQLSMVNGQISQARKDITSLQKELDNLKEVYASLVSAIYTKRRNSTWLMYVLASDDLSQAYRRLKYFRSFADLAVMQGEQVKNRTAELEAKRKELEENRKELQQLKTEHEAELKALAADETKLKDVQKSLEKEERTLKASLKKQQATLSSLNAEIKRMMQKVSGSGSSSGSGYRELPAAEKALSNRFEANRGKLPWPLKKGVVTMKYGAVKHPLFKSIELPPNDGITISTDGGADVLSIFDGEVIAKFPFQSYGNCVMVRHGEFISVYCRLKTVKVKVGDKVTTGEVLGNLNIENGNSSILYFQLWKRFKNTEVSQNPELWFVSNSSL